MREARPRAAGRLAGIDLFALQKTTEAQMRARCLVVLVAAASIQSHGGIHQLKKCKQVSRAVKDYSFGIVLPTVNTQLEQTKTTN